MVVHENFPLDKLNTFGISVSARYFTEVTELDELKQAISFAKENAYALLVLGGGSNILFTKNFDGIVIKNQIKGIHVTKEDSDFVWVEAKAGEVWHDFVRFTVNNGWGGIENLSLIPGSVGASPIQNIGAYGAEIKDTCVEVQTLEIESLQVKTFTSAECNFGYRDSYFKSQGKGKFIVTSVTYKLLKAPILNTNYGQIKDVLNEKGLTNPTIKDISEAVIFIRQTKLPNPSIIGNAGSFFKNPVISKELFVNLQKTYPNIPSYPIDEESVKVPAGWLIEQRGWKGKTLGHAGVHDKQALVLVNKNHASGMEIYRLAQEIQKDIQETFGIGIEMEVNIF